MSDQSDVLQYFQPSQVRLRARQFLDRAEVDALKHVSVNPANLERALQTVLETAQATYPDLQIPPYGVWRFFEAGGIDRWGALAGARAFETASEMLASAADLAILTCFMNTRRPKDWVFTDPMTGTQSVGEEASALATFHMFASGAFSSDMTDPYRVDAETLVRLEREELASGLQWPGGAHSGLVADMQVHLKRFGEALALRPDLFGAGNDTRPGLFATHTGGASDETVDILTLLDGLLEALAPVWEGGATEGEIALGDSFAHSALPGTEASFVQPFHLAAQQMVYALVEPFAWAGMEVSNLENLTAPSDFAHANLFVNAGVLSIKDAPAEQGSQAARDRMVELRAVTLSLTERLADLLRSELRVTPDQLPLTCVLEAGTRRAGEKMAQENAENAEKLSSFLNPGAVFWLPFGA